MFDAKDWLLIRQIIHEEYDAMNRHQGGMLRIQNINSDANCLGALSIGRPSGTDISKLELRVCLTTTGRLFDSIYEDDQPAYSSADWPAGCLKDGTFRLTIRQRLQDLRRPRWAVVSFAN